MATARYIAPEERARLLAELNNPRHRLLVLLGINTGYRISELLSLRWGQLWRDGKPAERIEVARRALKGGRSARKKGIRSRVVAVNDAAAEAIRECAFAVGGAVGPNQLAPVFGSQKSGMQPMSRRHAHEILSSAAQRAGLPIGIATHSLRRTFGRSVYELSGHDLLLTQRALGHRSVTSTQTYLQRTEDEAHEIVRALGALPSPATHPRSCLA